MTHDARHDEVVLTQAERRALADIEDALGESPKPGTLASAGWRYRLLAACHRWVRWGPWLVPLGAVLIVWALPTSLLASTAGAIVMAIGLAACLQHPWIRRRHPWLSSRRR